jgi:hypothetical protein
MKHKRSISAGLAAALLFILLAGFSIARGQTPAASKPLPPALASDLAEMVQKQFGKTFSLPAKFPTPMITGDFDGDGVEDVAIVADSAEPAPDSYQYKYSVADPYNAFFGLGNPTISANFGTIDTKHAHVLLVIFGAGAEAWRAAVPKAKFAIVNVPFDTVEAGRLLIKKDKPPIYIIRPKEAQILEATLFWEAKKKRWRWSPGNTPE